MKKLLLDLGHVICIGIFAISVGYLATVIVEQKKPTDLIQQRIFYIFGEGDQGEVMNKFIQEGDTTDLYKFIDRPN